MQSKERNGVGKHLGATMDAFREQVVEQYEYLFRFAQKLTGGNRSLSQDLVQDTVIRAFEKQTLFAPGTQLDSWLYRILQNRFRDVWRAEVKVRDPIEFSELEEERLELSVAAKQEQIAYYGQVAHKIRTLPGDQRNVMICVCIQELSYKETAERLGIPIGTVMSRLARARRSIQDNSETRRIVYFQPTLPRSRITTTITRNTLFGRQSALLFSQPALYLPQTTQGKVQVFRFY
jgi:RNA polymerase sigma-70 factor, ECF subfamily